MSIIKAPYNFVPLSNEVVTPEWVNHISHDIPFEDAQSGEIQVEITAHSPIFVRNGQPKNADTPSADFSQHEGNYFIPGSSLKGMVRNVLEIMTFGKMGDKVNDHRYALRDLKLKEEYLDHFTSNSVFCGWLSRNNEGKYQIEDCGHPGRISHRYLDDNYDTDFATYFLKEGDFDQTDDRQKSARFKYEKFEEIVGEEDELRINHFIINIDKNGRRIAEIAPDAPNSKMGEIVFTGQPSSRFEKNGKWEGHHLEFIFLQQARKNILPVDDTIIKDFFFAYFDHDLNRQSHDWKHWRRELAPGNRIPVFFHKKEGQVSALGLSYLFKLPYKKSIREAMPSGHSTIDKVDFSDSLFGFVQGESSLDSLKGRVHFGHAFAQGNCTPDETIKAVLSSPKASYYPNYVQQNVEANGQVRNYQTLMDEHAQIAGWKRYPIHKQGVKGNPPPVGSSDDVSVTFTPLQAGAQFSFSIRYHNLKKVELGALLSALTFHQSALAFHSLGMAKPLGYGKVKLQIANNTRMQQECLSAFEAYMSLRVKNWLQSPQLLELLAMAFEQNNTESSELAYMKLGVKEKDNQFTAAKNAKEGLNRYSKLPGISSQKYQTLLNSGDLEQASKDYARYKDLYKKPKSVDEIRNDLQMAFYKALEVKKAQLREELHQRKEALLENERNQTSLEKKIKAQQNGPDFSSIVPDSKNVFEDLKKVIRLFVEAYHGGKYDKLKVEMPTGVLPENFHAPLLEIIKKIAASNKKELENLQKPYDKNANLKKVAEWIGEEKAKGLKF